MPNKIPPKSWSVLFDQLIALLQRWNDDSLPVSWSIVAADILAAAACLWLASRLAQLLLRRLATRLAVSSELLYRANRAVRLVIILYLIGLILADAPASLIGMTWVRRGSMLALLVVATWAGVRFVRAAADLIIARYAADLGNNPQARRIHTQTRVLAHAMSALIMLLGLGLAFSTLPLMRQIGATFLASAGLAGLVVGFAAKPVLGNFLAGMQLALTQAIRLGDVVVVEQEWGWIEEITGTYVVLKIWDERRLVIPLQWFIEHAFQSWTRNQTAILGTVIVWVDYAMPTEPIRQEAERLCRLAPQWNQVLCVTQVTDATENAVQLRVLVSAADAGACWTLRCHIREGLLTFLAREFPAMLPRTRVELNTPAVV